MKDERLGLKVRWAFLGMYLPSRTSSRMLSDSNGLYESLKNIESSRDTEVIMETPT